MFQTPLLNQSPILSSLAIHKPCDESHRYLFPPVVISAQREYDHFVSSPYLVLLTFSLLDQKALRVFPDRSS